MSNSKHFRLLERKICSPEHGKVCIELLDTFRVTQKPCPAGNGIAPPKLGDRKKENELKQLKSEVAALERKIQLELTPPKPEAAQEQQADGGTAQTQSPPTGERATTEPLSDAPNRSQFLREYVQFVRPKSITDQVSCKGFKI